MKAPKLEIQLRHFRSWALTKERLRWLLQSPFSYLIFYLFWPSPFGADGIMLCYHHSGRFNGSSFQFWVSTRFQTQEKDHCPWNSHHFFILKHKTCLGRPEESASSLSDKAQRVVCHAKDWESPGLLQPCGGCTAWAEAASSLFLFSVDWLILLLKSKGVWKHLTASQRYVMRSNILSTELGARSF